MMTLNDIQTLCHCFRKARKHFDTSETSAEFGPVKIEYGKVRTLCLVHGDLLVMLGAVLRCCPV